MCKMQKRIAFHFFTIFQALKNRFFVEHLRAFENKCMHNLYELEPNYSTISRFSHGKFILNGCKWSTAQQNFL